MKFKQMIMRINDLDANKELHKILMPVFIKDNRKLRIEKIDNFNVKHVITCNALDTKNKVFKMSFFDLANLVYREEFSIQYETLYKMCSIDELNNIITQLESYKEETHSISLNDFNKRIFNKFKVDSNTIYIFKNPILYPHDNINSSELTKIKNNDKTSYFSVLYSLVLDMYFDEKIINIEVSVHTGNATFHDSWFAINENISEKELYLILYQLENNLYDVLKDEIKYMMY